MKSVVNERAHARRLVIGAAFASVVVGFVACSGSTEHKASPHVSAGGDATEHWSSRCSPGASARAMRWSSKP